MRDDVFESLIYENASGERTILSDRSVSSYWELRGRSGFSAPDVELITQKYINGQTRVVGRIIKPRTVSINMIVTGESTAKRDFVFFQMVESLIDVDGGDIGKLYITRSDGSVVYLNCAYSSGLKVADEYRHFHRFTLQFYAEDPYFYSTDFTQTVSVTEGSEPITLNKTLTLGLHGSWCLDWKTTAYGSGTVNNPYGHDADPVYRIAGKQSYLTIQNNTNSKKLTFDNLAMSQTDIIVIDTRDRYRAAYIEHADGSRTDILGSLIWTDAALSLPLVPGSNILTVTSFGQPENLEVSISMSALSA